MSGPGGLRYALAAAWTRLLLQPWLLGVFGLLAISREIESETWRHWTSAAAENLVVRLWGGPDGPPDWPALMEPLEATLLGARGYWGTPAQLLVATAAGVALTGLAGILWLVLRGGRTRRRAPTALVAGLWACGVLGAVVIAGHWAWAWLNFASGTLQGSPWWFAPVSTVGRLAAAAGIGGPIVAAIVLVGVPRGGRATRLLLVATATAATVGLAEGVWRVGEHYLAVTYPPPVHEFYWWRVGAAANVLVSVVGPLLLAGAIHGAAVHHWMRAPAAALALIIGSLIAHSVLDAAALLAPNSTGSVWSLVFGRFDREIRILPMALRGGVAILHAGLSLGCALALANLAPPEPERAATR